MLSNNKNTTILAQASDTLAVEAVTSFVRTLIVPEGTEPGTYLIASVFFRSSNVAAGGEMAGATGGGVFNHLRLNE